MTHPIFGEPSIEQRDELHVACIRRELTMAELPAFYDASFSAVFSALEAAGIAAAATPLGIVYGQTSGGLDLAVAVPVTEPFARSGQVLGATLPAARTAVLTIKGEYSQLAEAHGYLQSWVLEQGEETLGWAWEQYLTQPQPGGDPSSNITVIGVGLRG